MILQAFSILHGAKLPNMLYRVGPLSGAMGMDTWAVEEFGGVELGDARLNKRLIKLASDFADKPTASIPGACSGWAETQAAYRFFDQARTGTPQ